MNMHYTFTRAAAAQAIAYNQQQIKELTKQAATYRQLLAICEQYKDSLPEAEYQHFSSAYASELQNCLASMETIRAWIADLQKAVG